MNGDDQAALEALTHTTQALVDQLKSVTRQLITERKERHEEQKRIKDVGRRVFVALAVSMALFVFAGGVAVYAVNERADKLCEQTNESRRGNRNASRILIDKLFGLAAANQNPHSPTTAEQVEQFRVQVQAEILAELEETQPILNC